MPKTATTRTPSRRTAQRYTDLTRAAGQLSVPAERIVRVVRGQRAADAVARARRVVRTGR